MSTVLIGPEDGRDIILLNHPRTNEPCQYLLTGSDRLYEIIALSTPHKQSLLLQKEIIGVAPIQVATLIDPAFFLISALRKCAFKDKFVESDEIRHLLPCRIWPMIQSKLDLICDDTKGGGDGPDDRFWRLSQLKVESYLKDKVERVQIALPTSILDKLPFPESIHPLARQKAALELVSSYVDQELMNVLFDAYDFEPLKMHLAAQKNVINPNEFIKRKSGEEESNAFHAKKPKKGSKGVEALKKVNTRGMRSMTSFFTKKEKSAR